jgi:DNA polymerase-3 subunit delta
VTSPLLSKSGAALPCYVVQGEDESLVAQETSALIASLCDLGVISQDAVEEYGDAGQVEDLDAGTVLAACATPPFLTSARVVVVRDATKFDAAAQRDIVSYLDSPLESSVLVLCAPGRLTQALVKAVTARGLVQKAEPQNARGRTQWIAEHLHDAGLRLDAAASARLSEHLGEDLARLDGISKTLLAAYGPDATVHEADLEPFLGEAGSVAPWDLTDALDEGESAKALEVLHRMMDAGERHPLQLLSILHRHYGAMLRLDGGDIADESAASAATGLAPFPAKKALRQARRLGHDRIARAIRLLADADLDLRGRVGWPDELVMELLIARLAQLVRLPQGHQSPRPVHHRSAVSRQRGA